MRAAFAVASLSLAVVAAAQEAERRPFVRYVERDDGGQVDVLVASYRKGDATLVLHGALHVADPEHYRELQRRFEAFDALLYELIADADVRPYPGMETEDDWFSQIQSGMGRGVGLVAQGDHVDYRQGNFVHADMTPAQWERALERAKSSLLGELFSGGQAEPDREAEAKARPIDLVAAFRSGRGMHEMRIAASQLITTADGQTDEPTVIIEARNERCLAVLQEQVAAGKQKLGIYYGAAHMEHMERRLLQDLGWRRTGEEWLMAWDNRRERFAVVEKGTQQKRYRAKKDVDALSAALAAWAKEHAGKTPTWDGLRKLQPDGKLPGRADGVDPWGRPYELRTKGGGSEVRCAGPDGALDTEDDLTGGRVRVSKPGFFERLFSFQQRRREFEERLEAEQEGRAEDVRRMKAEKAALEGRPTSEARTLGTGKAATVEARAAWANQTTAEMKVAFFAAQAEFLRALHNRAPTLAELTDGSTDPWGNPYRLAVNADGSLEVRSDGPDGKQGTADDVVAPQAPQPAKK